MPQNGNLAAIGAVHAGNEPHRRGFSRAVAAQDREKLAPVGAQRQRFDNVGRFLVVPEKCFCQFNSGAILVLFCGSGRRNGGKLVRLRKAFQPQPSLRDRDGAGKLVRNARVDAHRNGHSGKHVAARLFQPRANLARSPGIQDAPALHENDVRRQGQRVLESVLGEDDRCAELAVDPSERRKKVCRGNRVELARRLVEQQDRRLERHDGRQIYQLLLPARELGHGLIKPVLDAKIRRNFRHAAADRRRVQSQRLQAKRQLVPDLVSH